MGLDRVPPQLHILVARVSRVRFACWFTPVGLFSHRILITFSPISHLRISILRQVLKAHVYLRFAESLR